MHVILSYDFFHSFWSSSYALDNSDISLFAYDMNIVYKNSWNNSMLETLPNND